MSPTRRSIIAGTAAAAAASLAPAVTPARAAVPLAGKQAPGFYRSKLGDYEVTVVTDGAVTIPLPDNLVVNASKDQVNEALAASFHQPDKLTNPFSPVVINTGSKLVAIDVGGGEAAFAQSKGATGQYESNLAAAGMERAAIDTVVISHFHGDHINGLLTADNKPAFANAEILVPEKEWSYWMDDGQMSRAPNPRIEGQFKNARRVFDALGRKVTPYAWDKEVAPGITAIGTPGHSPGHTSFVVASGARRLLLQVDVTTLPFLFVRNPGWHVVFDQDGAMAEATRRKLYDMASAEKMPVHGYHFPFPAMGYLEKNAQGYRLEPVAWSPVL
jgi:glyoxylase-like metal-dependent hydrolase (beta-lactamase superfamily II)